jgi:hypothetical protein
MMDGQTKNEIDLFITTRKKYIIDITVLNKFSVESDYRAVRETVKIDIKNTKIKMIKEKSFVYFFSHL